MISQFHGCLLLWNAYDAPQVFYTCQYSTVAYEATPAAPLTDHLTTVVLDPTMVAGHVPPNHVEKVQTFRVGRWTLGGFVANLPTLFGDTASATKIAPPVSLHVHVIDLGLP